MNYFLKLFFFSSVFFFNFNVSVAFGNLSPLATQSLHQVTINHSFDSPCKSMRLPKSFDPDFKQFLSSSVCDHTFKSISPIRPNGNWTAQHFDSYFQQLYHHDPTLIITNQFGIPELTPVGQQKILEQLPLYAYQGFREYVATFKEYSQFIRNLCTQLDNKDFCRPLNQQLTQSHEFQTSNQWQERIPVLEFYKLQQALPPEGYSQQRVTVCQQEAQQTAANKQTFINNAQQVLQDLHACPQFKQFAQEVSHAATTANGSCTTAQHEATPELLAAAKQHQMTAQDVQTTYGSEVKHVVQDGLMKSGNEAATTQKSNFLAPDITATALIGIQYNQAGLVDKALIIANFCHAALDYTKKFGSLTYDCAHGIGFGIIDGISNVGAMIQDPKKAALEMVTGLGHLGGYLFKVIYHVGTIKSEMDGESFGSCNQLEQFATQTGAVAAAIGQKLASTPTRELVRQIVSAGVEGWLSSKLLMTVGSFCDKTAKLCAVAAHEMKRAVQTAEIAEPIAAGVGKIGQPSRLQTWFNQIEEKIKGISGVVPQVTREIKHILPAGLNLDNVKQVSQTISARIGKSLDFAYEHIFGIEDVTKIKPSGLVKKDWVGFHHDYLGQMEKSGIIQLTNETICSKTGIITANASYNGIIKTGKTFFPREWSPEKVIEKITEAYNSFKGIPRLEGSRQVIECFTNEGMQIRIVFENNKMISAYPIIEKLAIAS